MAKYNNYYIVLDVETGGLPKKGVTEATIDIALTEIAFVAVDGVTLEIKEKKSWLLKPYSDNLIYGKEAEKVSGISKQMCEEEGKEIDEVISEILLFFKKYKIGSKKPILVGHNIIKFDFDFINNLLKIKNINLLNFVHEDIIKDTLLIAREKWVEGSFNLSACCQREGIELVNAHRALIDTISTAKLFISFMKSLRNETIVSNKKEVRYRENFQF